MLDTRFKLEQYSDYETFKIPVSWAYFGNKFNYVYLADAIYQKYGGFPTWMPNNHRMPWPKQNVHLIVDTLLTVSTFWLSAKLFSQYVIWIIETIQHSWNWDTENDALCFSHQSDLVLFKLTWG